MTTTAERVVARFKHEEMLKRIVAHSKEADVEVGRTVFTPQNLKIHRYADHLQITDMTNAGKRGKKVMQFVVVPTAYHSEVGQVILNNVAHGVLHLNYGQAKAHVEHVLAKSAEMGETPFNVRETAYRGVDVEPMGTKIELKSSSPDGATVTISASPHDFIINSSVPFAGPPGKPGFRQDTLYSPRKKQDGILFYGWLKDNMSHAAKMTIQDLTQLWHQIGVQYDYH